MRTTDRRDQLVRALRRRADWTVADLTRELGVSRRTVLGDLGALREAGFHLDTFSGPGGGVQLNPTSVMITSQLRTTEVIALIVSVEIARAAKTVPLRRRRRARHRQDRTSSPRCPSSPTASAAGADPGRCTVAGRQARCHRSEFGGGVRDRFHDQSLAHLHLPRSTRPEYASAGRTPRPAGAPTAVVRDRVGHRPQRSPALPRRPHQHANRQRPHFLARPSELVTGVCPDARPATTT